jgi:glycosyltransferase involved in cell wall biosynthesis
MRILLLDVGTSGHRIEYARYLIQHFTERDHEVLYCTLGEDDRINHLCDEGVEIRTFEKPPTIESTWNKVSYRVHLYQYYQSIFELANDWDANIVHHLFIDRTEVMLLPVLLKETRSDWKFFGTYFNQTLTEPTESIAKATFRFGQRISVRYLIRLGAIDGLFIHHPVLRERLAEELSINKEYIISIPDPIDPPVITDSKKTLRKRLSLPLKKTILLFFGGTRLNKGPDILLNSLTHIDQKELAVVFAGQAEDIDEEDIRHIEPRINSDISIISRFKFIPDDEVYQYFVASDAVVLPYRSTYRGTSGILQRAMASDRPVIGTDCGIIGTIIQEWNAGVVVEPDSALQLTQGIEEFLEKKNCQGIINNTKYVEAHHWKEFASRVQDTYKRQ